MKDGKKVVNKIINEKKSSDRKSIVKKVIKNLTNDDIPPKILRTATRAEDIVVLTSKGTTFRVTAFGEVFFEKVDFAKIDKEFQAFKKREMEAILGEAQKILENNPELAKQAAKETGVLVEGKKNKKAKK